ncbi:MAG: methyl-accepting chemotaxis protein, partial [Deltaproteobacteria bacterium]|nr:methyl-accepting chemotaxis protein [Deltaproteobacteria bacterium]
MKSAKFDWNSLTTRLTMTVAVLLIVVTGAVTAFSVFRAKSAMEDSLRNHGRILISALDTTATEYLELYNYTLLKGYVEKIAQKESAVSYVLIADVEGRIVAHSEHSQEGQSVPDVAVNTVAGKEVTERKTQYKNARVLELTAPLTVSGTRRGTIRLGLNYEGVNRTLRRLVLSISLAGLVLLCLAILIVRTLTSKVAADLTDLIDKTRKISEGELHIEVPERGYREVRALAHAFNVMAQNLSSVLKQIGDMGSHISAVFSNMLTVIQDQAASASQQAASVSEVTATVEELSRTSHQIAENAESVKNASAKTAEMAQHGTVLMRDGVGAMEQVRQRVGDIAKRNQFLGEKSQEIGKVMEIIKEIASETHLLALNAAIESAAAGEHGRR